MTFIKMIEQEEAEGALKDIYEDILAWRNGRLPPPFKAVSLNPEAVSAMKATNMAITFGNSTLGVRREEMLATVISTMNECDY